jgi:hypothetical protein
MDFLKQNFLPNQTIYSFYEQKLFQSKTSSLNAVKHAIILDATAQTKHKTSQHQQKAESMSNET